jgi:dolichyl-phosphate-mannose-protein mannosyltransferase
VRSRTFDRRVTGSEQAGSVERPSRKAWSWDHVRAKVAAIPIAAWLVAFVAASAMARFVLALGDPAPFIFQDELLYSELAKSYAATGHFALRDVPGSAGVAPLYPVLISPAYALFENVPQAYLAVKAINSLLMSLAAVPIYLTARRLLAPLPSLVAAGLSLTMPWLVYTTLVMTENAFYLVFVCWFLALVLMLERPTLTRQAAMLVLVGLAYETRAQAVALVPALVTALVLVALGDAWFGNARPRWRAALSRAAAFWPTWLALVLGTVVFAVVELGIRGKTVSDSLFGSYAVLGQVDYSIKAVLRWTLWEAGELDVVVGVIPFAAFLAVVLAGCRRESTSPALRAFAAAALATSFWILLEVGAFASSPHSHRMEERNFFYVVPFLLIALVLWAWRGVGRESPAAASAALLAGALPGVVPLADFINENTVNDSFGLLNILVLRDKVGAAPDNLNMAVVLASIAAAGLFLFLPRRWSMVAPALVFAFFAYGNRSVEFFTDNGSRAARHAGTEERRDWIDQTVGHHAQVATVLTRNRDRLTLWENEFFNRSVRNVYSFVGRIDGLPHESVGVDPNTGALTANGKAVGSEYVLADTTLLVDGEELARDPKIGLALYRTAGTIRFSAAIAGLYPDDWSGPTLTYLRYACEGGALTVVLKQRPVTVVARSSGRELGRIVLQPVPKTYRFTVPLVQRNGGCQVDFSVHPTAVPAQVPGAGGDSRELGVHVRNFVFRPR